MWSRLFYKMAAMTSSFDQFTSNLNAHPLAYVKLFLESFVEISPEVSPNGPGQTDRHTHRQTPPVFPYYYSTIGVAADHV